MTLGLFHKSIALVWCMFFIMHKAFNQTSICERFVFCKSHPHLSDACRRMYEEPPLFSCFTSGSCSHHLCRIVNSRPSFILSHILIIYLLSIMIWVKSDRENFSFIAAIFWDVVWSNRQTAIKPTSLMMTTHQQPRCVCAALQCTFILSTLCFCC